MNIQPPITSTEGMNDDGGLIISSKQQPPLEPVKNSYMTNTIASQGPFMSNNGLGAGRSLSQKTWTLINKNIKGIEEQSPLVPPVSSK